MLKLKTGPEGELRLYLDGLADAEDIPSYLKNHPFGQSPITHDHPDWEFYSKIISSLKWSSVLIIKVIIVLCFGFSY